MKLKAFIVTLSLVVLSGCAVLKDNAAGILGGASSLAQAPQAQEALKACVADDPVAQEKLQAPAEFFKTGYDVLTQRGADVPVLSLIEEFNDYYSDIPDQWNAVWTALDGKDCGQTVAQFKANGEQAWASIQKASIVKDRLKTACGYYQMIAPLATALSPIPLPRSVPGC